MAATRSPFDDRVYIVTGSTQGVGAAMALALARAGARALVICGRNRDGGASVKSAIEAAGAAAEYVRADLSQEADCRAVTDACDKRFGRLDGLVNAAGDTTRGSIETTPVETWDRLFAINVRAPFILMQDGIKLMRREHLAGTIINIITQSSYGGQPFITAYCASKGALVALTKNVANAVRKDRIRVNGVNLGWTDTPNERKARIAQGYPEDWLAKAEAEQPFGRLIKPEDVARLGLFLLGPDSGIMTGAVIDFSQRVMGAWD